MWSCLGQTVIIGELCGKPRYKSTQRSWVLLWLVTRTPPLSNSPTIPFEWQTERSLCIWLSYCGRERQKILSVPHGNTSLQPEMKTWHGSQSFDCKGWGCIHRKLKSRFFFFCPSPHLTVRKAFGHTLHLSSQQFSLVTSWYLSSSSTTPLTPWNLNSFQSSKLVWWLRIYSLSFLLPNPIKDKILTPSCFLVSNFPKTLHLWLRFRLD